MFQVVLVQERRWTDADQALLYKVSSKQDARYSSCANYEGSLSATGIAEKSVDQMQRTGLPHASELWWTSSHCLHCNAAVFVYQGWVHTVGCTSNRATTAIRKASIGGLPSMRSQDSPVHDFVKVHRDQCSWSKTPGCEVQGLEDYGVGKWREIVAALLPRWKESDIRLKACRALGSQSLVRYAGWRGDRCLP